jgi:RHS repeat-associated protein
VDTYRLFIPTPMGVVGVWNRGDLGDQKRYHHKDLLGSVGLETNENGTVQNQYAYDPWGAPRTPATWASLSTWPNYGSDRGYTSHEMLEGVDLVHMNGRIYDPAIGRFLTADPFVQFSGDSQSYNRYSYVLNNPLRYTDPSGHFLFSLGMAAYWAGADITAKTFGYFVASMFAAGFVDTFMMSGGDVDQALQAGAFTAAASVVTFGIGTAFESPTGGLLGALEDKPTLLALAQHTAHGISSGAFTELAGGDFGAGFAAGMAGSFGGSIAQSRGGVQGFLVATIAGGTASELGGGKFANGAISGAFVYLLNHEAHGDQDEGSSPQDGDIEITAITAGPAIDGASINDLIGVDFNAAAVGSVMTLASNVPIANPVDESYLIDVALWLTTMNPSVPGSGDAINGFVTAAEQNARLYLARAVTRPTEIIIRIEYRIYRKRWYWFDGWEKKSYHHPFKPGGRGLPNHRDYQKGINDALEKFKIQNP